MGFCAAGFPPSFILRLSAIQCSVPCGGVASPHCRLPVASYRLTRKLNESPLTLSLSLSPSAASHAATDQS